MIQFAKFNDLGDFIGIQLSEPESGIYIALEGSVKDDFESKIKPKLENGQIVEGATEEEVYQLNYQKIIEDLVQCCIYLRDRAKISSVNKEPSTAYLEGQIPIYQEKYNCAKEFLLNGSTNNNWYQPIVDEMTNTNALLGTNFTISEFMQLIVNLWDAGEDINLKFQTAIEVFRCKTKDLATAGEFQRAKQCLSLGWAVPQSFDLIALENLKAQLQLI